MPPTSPTPYEVEQLRERLLAVGQLRERLTESDAPPMYSVPGEDVNINPLGIGTQYAPTEVGQADLPMIPDPEWPLERLSVADANEQMAKVNEVYWALKNDHGMGMVAEAFRITFSDPNALSILHISNNSLVVKLLRNQNNINSHAHRLNVHLTAAVMRTEVAPDEQAESPDIPF